MARLACRRQQKSCTVSVSSSKKTSLAQPCRRQRCKRRKIRRSGATLHVLNETGHKQTSSGDYSYLIHVGWAPPQQVSSHMRAPHCTDWLRYRSKAYYYYYFEILLLRSHSTKKGRKLAGTSLCRVFFYFPSRVLVKRSIPAEQDAPVKCHKIPNTFRRLRYCFVGTAVLSCAVIGNGMDHLVWTALDGDKHRSFDRSVSKRNTCRFRFSLGLCWGSPLINTLDSTRVVRDTI